MRVRSVFGDWLCAGAVPAIRGVPSRSGVASDLFHFTRPFSFVTTPSSSSHVTLILAASAPLPSHEPETLVSFHV